jgi:hypothetical protein
MVWFAHWSLWKIVLGEFVLRLDLMVLGPSDRDAMQRTPSTTSWRERAVQIETQFNRNAQMPTLDEVPAR